MDADLASLIEFLQNFRTNLSSLPTDEGAEQIASTIESVKDLVRVAEADPVMCRVLGLSDQARPNSRPRRRPTSAADRDASRKALSELQDMPLHDVEQVLTDRATYNVQALKAVAEELGLRTPSKATRLSIIEKITKTLANRQGYEYLRSGGP